jgi:hypothetical protein
VLFPASHGSYIKKHCGLDTGPIDRTAETIKACGCVKIGGLKNEEYFLLTASSLWDLSLHTGGCEEFHLMGYNAVQSVENMGYIILFSVSMKCIITFKPN